MGLNAVRVEEDRIEQLFESCGMLIRWPAA